MWLTLSGLCGEEKDRLVERVGDLVACGLTTTISAF